MKLKNVYITSDLHIGSTLIANTRGFDTWEEAWINYKFNHNNLIKDKNQVVIIVGDICSNKRYQHHLKELNGTLHFVLGNHDLGFDYNDYGKAHPMLLSSELQIIITHIPVHPCYFYGRQINWMNAHGHLHDMFILTEEGYKDKRYINVCPDVNNNSPTPLTTLIEKTKQEPNKFITFKRDIL
jgi:calcineurin-like phosphoesterase family protein